MSIELGKIQYSVVSTHETVEARRKKVPVVDFRKSDIVTLYELSPKGLGMTTKKIAGIVEASPSAIGNRLRKAGVETRGPFADPNLEIKRVEGIRRAYRERHDEMVAKITTPELNAKRSTSMTRYHKNNPMEEHRRQLFLEGARSYRERVSAQAREKKAQKLTEERERRISASNLVLHHPNFNILPERTQRVLRLRYKLDGSSPMTYKEIGNLFDGISKQGIQQLIATAIVILEKGERVKKPVKEKRPPGRPNVVGESIRLALNDSPSGLTTAELLNTTKAASIRSLYSTIYILKLKLFQAGLTIVNEDGRYQILPKQTTK